MRRYCRLLWPIERAQRPYEPPNTARLVESDVYLSAGMTGSHAICDGLAGNRAVENEVARRTGIPDTVADNCSPGAGSRWKTNSARVGNVLLGAAFAADSRPARGRGERDASIAVARCDFSPIRRRASCTRIAGQGCEQPHIKRGGRGRKH